MRDEKEDIIRLADKPEEVNVSQNHIIVETPGREAMALSERSSESIKVDRETGKFSNGYIKRHYPNS